MAVGACRRLRHVASIAANFEEPTTRKFQSVVVARTQEGLSIHEIGEWAEGACGYGPWVACTRDHLITAVRFLIVQRRLADLREEAPEVDTASVEQQARTIRTSLGRIKTVKTKLTAIDACSGSIGVRRRPSEGGSEDGPVIHRSCLARGLFGKNPWRSI